jgi:hypothetical protein
LETTNLYMIFKNTEWDHNGNNCGVAK